MGLSPSDTPLMLTAGLKTEFMTGRSEYTAHIQPLITTTVKSTKASETYGWLGESGEMKEWISERTPKALREHGFTIVNKDYEHTIEVDRNCIEDDQYGEVAIRVKNMGSVAERWKDKRLTAVIEAGTTELCYDGQYFFDTDHSEGLSGSQSNAPAAALAYRVSTAAEAVTVLNAVTHIMAQFKDDAGLQVGRKPTHVMCPTNIEYILREAFDPSFRGTGTTTASEMGKGRVQVISNEYLTNAATVGYSVLYWLDLSETIKPFIFQNRKDPEFVAKDKPTDEGAFWSKKLYYGVDLRGNFGYGDWRKAVRTEGAAS